MNHNPTPPCASPAPDRAPRDPRHLLEQVAAGTVTVEQALTDLAAAQTALRDLDFARVDLQRFQRRGLPETIYSPGKTPEQVVRIMRALSDAGQPAMATRVSAQICRAVLDAFPKAVHHPQARALTLDPAPLPEPCGCVAVVAAGTSDIPVAAEACLAAARMGAHVERVFDVGVAGLHRLLPHLDALRAARVVVVVAGMEGALPSVVGGLVGKPIVAVPTSIGYGSNFQGLSALLAMLNSCVAGITVVNIDNGFGAGVAAGMINRTGEKTEP